MGIAPAKLGTLKMPDACVPLHATREAALKLLMHPDERNLELQNDIPANVRFWRKADVG